jgi:hypothetical protein
MLNFDELNEIRLELNKIIFIYYFRSNIYIVFIIITIGLINKRITKNEER